MTIISSLAAASGAARFDQDEHAGLVIVRGRAMCLDAGGRPVDSLFACTSNSRFGFARKDGKLYKFLPTDTTAMFTDIRVRQRELQVTAQLAKGGQLEIINVQSIKEGKLYDIYYFCEVCNIKAYAPGPCPCCRNELEFRETPP
jgi:hypothetical protein